MRDEAISTDRALGGPSNGVERGGVDVLPTLDSMAPCSPPSRPLRAAFGLGAWCCPLPRKSVQAEGEEVMRRPVER
jgi:hypothetical protein